ncbi:MAG: GNAT family N-acetyltransferase [Anaerolineales bacterium]
MFTIHLPQSPLKNLHTLELGIGNENLLQRFFEENPEYFLTVQGEPAGPNEAYEEIHGQLPEGWGFTRKWVIGYLNENDSLVAVVNIISDFLVSGVWHIGLFMVATSLHGSGTAQTIYHSIEHWAKSNSANWVRIGVVQGNARAERFWETLGFLETRTRTGYKMGKQINTVRVMVKPLTGGTLQQYLSLIERDRPESL